MKRHKLADYNFNFVTNLTNRRGRIIIPCDSPIAPSTLPPPWIQIQPFLKLLQSI